MGKSNRIRVSRANDKIRTLGVKNKRKGMPSWAMSLITVVLALALLLSVSGILLSANGVFTRLTPVVTSANYKVDANMMAYYYNTQYQNFYSNYSTYLQSGYFSLDTTKPLDEQPFGGAEGSTNYDKVFLGEFTGTWHDYFMTSAVDTVKNMLMYCEAAPEFGVSLTDEDYAEIDANMEYYATMATSNGYPSVSSFLSANYGKGVSEGDVRKCMEYSMLASKTMTALAEKLDGEVLPEHVDAKYNEGENYLDYNVIDYTYYSFKVNYDEVAKEVLGSDYKEADLAKEENKAKVLAEYKKQIEAARTAAKELEAKTGIDDFKAYIYNYVATDSVDDTYASKVTGENKGSITDEQAALIKKELVKAAVAEAVQDKDKAEAAVVIESTDDAQKDYSLAGVEGVTFKKAYATVLNTIKDTAFSAVKSATTTYNVEKSGYVKDNDFSEWAFKTGKKDDIKLIADYDGSKDGAITEEITNDKGQSHVSVYFLTEAQRKDTEKARNLSFMVFGTEATAKAAIAELVAGGTVNQETFLKMAETKEATNSSAVTDYTKGNMGSTEFDDWAFSADRKSGDLTAEPIKTTSDSSTVYIVALYEGEGQQLWYLDVKSTIVNEKAEAEATRLEGAHPITVYENRYRFVKTTV